MSDGDAILLAILDEPGEDVHRLVYADWLEDNGQAERAEFIRVQIELHRGYRVDPATREYMESGEYDNAMILYRVHEATWKANLDKKQCALFRDSGPKWWNGLPGSYRATVEADISIQTAEGWNYFVRRGFVSEVKCHMSLWLDHGKDIYAMHPIERVEITDRSVAQSLGNPPQFCWFRRPQEHPKNQVFGMSHLHQGIFDLLEGGTLNHGNWCRFYPTETEAIDALSRACLTYARQLTQSPTAKV